MDERVPMSELQALWDECKARGELWNGMTDHYLRERYGDRLCHVMGDGWYVRPATVAHTASVAEVAETEPCLMCGEPSVPEGQGPLCERCEAGQDAEAAQAGGK